MQCPKCKNASLEKFSATENKFEVDRCTECRGVWFDREGLVQLLGVAATSDLQIHKHAMQMEGVDCPRCHESLYEFCYPGTMTLIDGCRQCDGYWFDDNEWNLIHHAFDESRSIHCPKCFAWQIPAENCSSCGVLMEKYQAAIEERNQRNKLKREEAREEGGKKSSFADDIPGLKGVLLRFIDRTIKDLS